LPTTARDAALLRVRKVILSRRRRYLTAFRVVRLILLGLALPDVTAAQQPVGIPAETVTWTSSVQSGDAAQRGGKLTLALHGSVLDSWHVYSLYQLPNGPIPLRVALDSGDIATADGQVVESTPTKARDEAFGFETQFYSKAFTVTLPVRLGANVSPGRQVIPLSVRFQTCNGRICQPPKTVRLSVPVTVKAGG
jgi:hypothetical protein